MSGPASAPEGPRIPETSIPQLDAPVGAAAVEPFLGLRAFGEADQGVFFGRDREKTELLRLVRREILTVLFGISGLGKTSLLQAGLFPLLRELDMLPIPIRLDHRLEALDLDTQVLERVQAVLAEVGLEGTPYRPGETLWEYFNRVPIWSRRNRLLVPVLVIDQFEEAFTQARDGDRLKRFLVDLGDLVENRIPERVRTRAVEGLDLTSFADSGPRARVILSLREDFLPDLEDLRTSIPSIAENRYRLTQMTGEQALEAVLRPAGKLVSAEVAERIVHFVSGSSGDSRATPSAEKTPTDLARLRVEPALLSLVCRELNERRQRLGHRAITADLLHGAREQILSDFYEQCLAGEPRALRIMIEERLIDRAGFRSSEALENALAERDITRESVARLIDRRLLRLEDRFGTRHLELIHDRMTSVVRDARDLRRRREARARRRRRLMVGGATTLATLIVAIGVAYREWQARHLYRAELDRANVLIDTVLFDLKERLEPLGRLDILDTAARGVLNYYQSSATESEDPGSARRRASALLNLGNVLTDQGKLEEALTSYGSALNIRERLATGTASDPDLQADVAATHRRIGLALEAQGRLPEALAAHEQALAIRQRLAARDPSNPVWQAEVAASYNNIGVVLYKQVKYDEALASYQSAVAIRERLTGVDPSNTEWQSDLAASHSNIGVVLAKQGKLDEALTAYRAALTIRERLADNEPSNTTWQTDLGQSHNNIGVVLYTQGRLDEALASHRAALAIRERLTKTDPTNTTWQSDLAASYNNIGLVFGKRGEFGEMLRSYQAALAIRERLASLDPSNTTWQSELAQSHNNIGVVLYSTGRLREALASHREALAIRERLATADPSNTVWQVDLAQSLGNLGDAENARDAVADALASYRAAVAIRERLAEQDPANVAWEKELAYARQRVQDLQEESRGTAVGAP